MVIKNSKSIILILMIVLAVSNLYSQNCNIISKANDIIPNGLCAPVTVSWEVTYRGVNDGGTPVEIQFDWDDGTVEVIAAVNTSIPLQEWQVTHTHVYPPGGNQCTYQPTATLMVNGVLCTSTSQNQVVTVWDTDDENGGQIAIDPVVFPICVGNDGCTYFTDVSLFNCVPPVENDNPNNPTRWTQWVYGTNYTINNVTVDGVVQTYPYYGAVVPLPGPVYGPGPPNNVSLECCAPATAAVGEFFEVTLRNWNYCNPYDDPNIPGPPVDPVNGDYPPVETTAIILIVPYPDATITPQGPFCENDPPVNFSAATPGGTWSGQGITNSNNGTFNPSVAGPGNHTITYSVTDANGCTGVDTYDVTVYAIPDPNILPGPNSEVCPGDPLILDGNPTPGDGNITTHLWTGDTSPLNFTDIQAPTFLTSSQGLYNMTYTVTDDNGCSASENVSVSVNPVMANIIPDPAQTCVNEVFALNGNPSGGTGNYVSHIWTGDIIYLNNSSIQNPVFSCPAAGVYNLTYSVTDDNGCNDSDNITITVYDNPVAYAGVDSGLCGNTITLYAVPSLGTGTWTQASGPGTSTFTNSNNPTTDVVVSDYGSYDFVWTEVYGAGCTDSDTVTITFYEQPVSFAGVDDSICGTSYVLQAVASSGTGTWSEISGPGLPVFTNVNDPNTQVDVNMYGSYVFMWKEDNNGCVDSNLVTINFDIVPSPDFLPADTSGCPPFDIQFINTTTSGVSYEWDFGDGNTSTDVNPANTFYNSTTNDLTYTISMVAESMYGCKDSVQHQLTVHPIPHADFNSDAIPQCSPVSVNFTNNSSGSVMHIWHYGDGTPADTADNPSHTFINNTFLIQYYQVDLLAVSPNGCIDTFSQYVTVYPNPHNDFTVIPDTSCHPATVQFMADPGGASYNWDFGDGSTISATNIITHNYQNNGITDTTYYVTLITASTFGCIDTAIKPVTVYPKPVADFTANQMTGCSPMFVEFYNNSSGATTYNWNFGDGNSDTLSNDTIYHVFNNSLTTPVTYYVSLMVTNQFGCSDSMKLQIVVNPEIAADFVADTAGCANFLVDFNNQSSGAVNYQWDFGDGTYSSSLNPSHIYINTSQNPDTFNVVMVASSLYGCNDTASSTIIVYPSPIAAFNLSNTSGCSPMTVQISNNSIGSAINFWNYGDGTSEFNSDISFNHTFNNSQNNPVNYNIWLIAENNYGCKDSVNNIITVNPVVHAYFICDTIGCHPFTVSFTNQSYGASTYQWNFGDGNSSQNQSPVHIFNNTTNNQIIYTVYMTATSPYGCNASYSQDIYVIPQPVAGFFANPPVQLFNGDSNLVSFVNTSTPGSWNYHWNFGDGNTSTDINPNHYYHDYGIFDVELIVYNSYCSDTIVQTVEITQPPPVAAFSGNGKGCAPLTVEFENNSLYGEDYLWYFGDNKSSTDFAPSHTYTLPGNYTVTLIVTNDFGSDTVTISGIEVYENPTAYFTASPKLVYMGEPVTVNNQSINADYYSWDFESDGTEDSNVENPVIYYDKIGTYFITLIVRTQYYCQDTFKLPEAVTVSNAGEIEFPNAFTPNPSGPNGGYWGGTYNDNSNDIFHPKYHGVAEYKLMIFNRWGELIFESTNPDIGWDGYYRGKLCKQDVYVWKVVGKYSNGQDFMDAGDVTLLH